MQQSVSGLIKSNANTNKCQHFIIAQHVKPQTFQETENKSTGLEISSKTPNSLLFNWRFFFLQSCFFLLVLHFRIFHSIRGEGIVKVSIWLAHQVWFNHRCHCAAQGTALTFRVSDPRHELNSSPLRVQVMAHRYLPAPTAVPLCVRQRGLSHWNLWDFRPIANKKKNISSLKR